MKYAGIGSRQTPTEILHLMEDFGYAFACEALLRSGGAEGADLAFEFGARLGGGQTEIYLPWKGFNDRINNHYMSAPSPAAIELAKQYHPGWNHLTQGAKLLIARNGHQVLGKNLDDPVDMVICWTNNGSITGKEPNTGGTGQALRIAADHPGIQVYNLKNRDHLEWLQEVIGDDGIPLGRTTIVV